MSEAGEATRGSGTAETSVEGGTVTQLRAVAPVPDRSGRWTRSHDVTRRRPRWERRAKRVLDVIAAPAMLVVLSPVLAASAIAVRLDSAGPAVFRQTRVGADGRHFTVLKLRTMFVDNDDRRHREYVGSLLDGQAERVNGLFKLADDPRITRAGRVLRRLSIDEVPQLVNVVRGEMSLVGPRPPLPTEVEMYDNRQLGRLSGKPGVTGMWQVSGRSELGYREMIELDIEYFERWSFWLDLKILARTPRAVFSQRGAA